MGTQTEEFKSKMTKKYRLPNLKNAFSFTLRDNKLKGFKFNYENNEKLSKDSVSINQITIKNTDSEKEKMTRSYFTCLGNDKIYDGKYMKLNSLYSDCNQVNKYLIKNSNTSKASIKNYCAYHCSDLTEPTLYNLPNNISKVILSNEAKCLIFKQGKKYSNKGRMGSSLYKKELDNSEIIDEIKKKE